MVIIAKLTHEGKLYVGKREVKMYNTSSKLTDELIAHANVGLTLEAQRSIREAVSVKNGIKKVTSGGKAVDLSSIEAV